MVVKVGVGKRVSFVILILCGMIRIVRFVRAAILAQCSASTVVCEFDVWAKPIPNHWVE